MRDNNLKWDLYSRSCALFTTTKMENLITLWLTSVKNHKYQNANGVISYSGIILPMIP